MRGYIEIMQTNLEVMKYVAGILTNDQFVSCGIDDAIGETRGYLEEWARVAAVEIGHTDDDEPPF